MVFRVVSTKRWPDGRRRADKEIATYAELQDAVRHLPGYYESVRRWETIDGLLYGRGYGSRLYCRFAILEVS